MLKSKLLLAILSISIFSLYTYLVYSNGVDSGKAELISEYNEKLKEKEDKILKLKNDLVFERQAALTLNETLGMTYEEKIDEQKENYERAISELESDVFRLRVNIGEGDPIETGTPVPAPAKACDNERPRTYLPKDTSRLLIEQASKADEVVEQLTACQQTIRLYLKLVDRYNALIGGDTNGIKPVQLDD
jgi:hypothetical protein